MIQLDCICPCESRPLQVSAAYAGLTLPTLPTLQCIVQAQSVHIPAGGLYLPAQGVRELHCVFATMLDTLDVLATSRWGRTEVLGVHGVPLPVMEYLEVMPRSASDWLSQPTVDAMKAWHHHMLAAAHRRCATPGWRAGSSAKVLLLQAATAAAVGEIARFISDSADDSGGVLPQELAQAVSCMEFAQDLLISLEAGVDDDARTAPHGLLAKLHRRLEQRNVLALQERPLQVIRSTFDALVVCSVQKAEPALNFAQ